MKKRFSILGIIVVFGVTAFLTSCEVLNTCYCTTTDNVSKSKFESDLKKAVKDASTGLSVDFSDVESTLESRYGYRNVSCE